MSWPSALGEGLEQGFNALGEGLMWGGAAGNPQVMQGMLQMMMQKRSQTEQRKRWLGDSIIQSVQAGQIPWSEAQPALEKLGYNTRDMQFNFHPGFREQEAMLEHKFWRDEELRKQREQLEAAKVAAKPTTSQGLQPSPLTEPEQAQPVAPAPSPTPAAPQQVFSPDGTPAAGPVRTDAISGAQVASIAPGPPSTERPLDTRERQFVGEPVQGITPLERPAVPETKVTATKPKEYPDLLRDEARELEARAENARALGTTAGFAIAKELDAEASKRRHAAVELEQRIQAETRIEEATKRGNKTPFMKELDRLQELENLGQGKSEEAKYLRDHLRKMDAPPQWLAQAPTPITPEQAKLSGEEFLKTLPVGEQILVKGIADLDIDPASVSTRNNQRQGILEKVKKYKPDWNQQDFKESQSAAIKFGSGPQGNAVRSFNVALEHLDTLQEAAAALTSGKIPAFNAIRNRFRQETGSELPTNFEGVKRVVAAEVVKAIIGGGTAGALTDREEQARTYVASSSPAQIVGVIGEMKALFGGQIHGLEQQYRASTKRNDFRDRYLTDKGRKAIASVDADLGKTPDMRGQGGMKSKGGDLPRPATPEEASKLPPGTRFVDPEGVVRIR